LDGYTHSAICLTVCLFVAVWPAIGSAQSSGEPTPIAKGRPASVVVVPTSFQTYRTDALGQHTRALYEGTARFAANHPDTFSTVTPQELRSRVEGRSLYEDRLEVAQQWARLGVKSYKRLNTAKAIDQLEKAVQRFDDIDYQLVAPNRVAEVLMYLSLSYLAEDTNAARSLVLMKRMIRLDPTRVLRRGYYPDDIVNFYRSAREDVIAELREEGPAPARARRIASITGADLVVFGHALPDDEGTEITLRVFSTRQQGFVEPLSLGIDGPAGPEALKRVGNRLMSRVATCVYTPAQPSRSNVFDSKGNSPFSLRVDFAYMSWLKYPEPLESPFGNLGLEVGAEMSLTDEVGLGLGVQVVNSVRDYNGVLTEDFSTLRVFFGPTLGFQLGRFNIGVDFAVEASHIGSIVLCTDLNDVPLGCPDPSDRRTFEELNFMLGINAHPRVHVRVFDTLSVTAGASISYYFIPFSGRPLGYPLTATTGVRYRF
jgi:hypothetical protein